MWSQIPILWEQTRTQRDFFIGPLKVTIASNETMPTSPSRGISESSNTEKLACLVSWDEC